MLSDPMSSPVTTTTKAAPLEVRKTAQTLYFAGLPPKAIAAELSLSPNLVIKWITRYGWRDARDKSKQILVTKAETSLAREAANEVIRRSDKVRTLLASEVEGQASALAKAPPKRLADLANTPERQGRTAVLKTLTDAAATVFGWGSDSPGGVVALVELPREGVLDVDATVTSQDLRPETPQQLVVESSPDGITAQGQAEIDTTETPSTA